MTQPLDVFCHYKGYILERKPREPNGVHENICSNGTFTAGDFVYKQSGEMIQLNQDGEALFYTIVFRNDSAADGKATIEQNRKDAEAWSNTRTQVLTKLCEQGAIVYRECLPARLSESVVAAASQTIEKLVTKAGEKIDSVLPNAIKTGLSAIRQCMGDMPNMDIKQKAQNLLSTGVDLWNASNAMQVITEGNWRDGYKMTFEVHKDCLTELGQVIDAIDNKHSRHPNGHFIKGVQRSDSVRSRGKQAKVKAAKTSHL